MIKKQDERSSARWRRRARCSLRRRPRAAIRPNSISPTYKKDTDVACLYHCDFGDPQRFSQMLQNMHNH